MLTKPAARDVRATFTQDLFRGLKAYGFVILKDHDIDANVLQTAYDLSAAFFNLPLNEKLQYDSGQGGQRGYTAFGREHAKDNDAPDLKEFWHVGREFEAHDALGAVYPSNIWPENPAGFREAFLSLYAHLEEAGLDHA